MADVKKVSYRRCKDGWVRIAVPQKMLHKQYMEVPVVSSYVACGHVRMCRRWMPLYPIQSWLSENAGSREKWKMDHRTREIAVQDEQVAFMFKLRWA